MVVSNPSKMESPSMATYEIIRIWLFKPVIPPAFLALAVLEVYSDKKPGTSQSAYPKKAENRSIAGRIRWCLRR